MAILPRIRNLRYRKFEGVERGRLPRLEAWLTQKAVEDVGAGGLAGTAKAFRARFNASTEVVETRSLNNVNVAAHGLAAGTAVYFRRQDSGAIFPTEGSGVNAVTVFGEDSMYYVRNPQTNGFELSATPGGSRITFSTVGSGNIRVLESIFVEDILKLLLDGKSPVTIENATDIDDLTS